MTQHCNILRVKLPFPLFLSLNLYDLSFFLPHMKTAFGWIEVIEARHALHFESKLNRLGYPSKFFT